jgi:TDG/mug DNA glycosylase family protein
MQAPETEERAILPDIISPGLSLLIVGTTVGQLSALRGHYHSGLHNCFWRLLHAAGFTPEVWTPEEDTRLPSVGIGLTDLRKDLICNDDRLLAPLTKTESAAFFRKVQHFRPRIVCFNGKSPYRMWSGCHRVEYGLQEKPLAESKIFVAPSTSGAGTGITELRRCYYQMLQQIAQLD